ncbi:MAG: uroporphyrinogen decarboxylase family protein, partial [Bacillota bacterium]
EGGKMVISPLIESSEEVDEIEPVPPEKGDAGRAVKIWKEISCRLQTDNLTCSFIDMQGPLNTASLLWKQDEFMIAMHKHPEKVHQLLEQVTDQIIKIYKYMINKIGEKNIFGSLWPYIWLPSDIGVKIVEDYMPLLSPELYREFGLPYLEKISEEIGAIFIHCCGDYSHQLDNLKNSSINLLGLEFHSPYMNPEELFDKFQDKVFVPFGCEVNELVRMDKGDNRLWFVLNDETKEIKKKVKFIYNNL